MNDVYDATWELIAPVDVSRQVVWIGQPNNFDYATRVDTTWIEPTLTKLDEPDAAHIPADPNAKLIVNGCGEQRFYGGVIANHVVASTTDANGQYGVYIDANALTAASPNDGLCEVWFSAQRLTWSAIPLPPRIRLRMSRSWAPRPCAGS